MVQDRFSLPLAIERFVSAVNRFDGKALLETFVEDAFVNDNRREFRGKPAIGKFLEREFIGDKVTMAITDVRTHYAMIVVAATFDGLFDKTNLPDPLILTSYFILESEKIASLFIIHNQPTS